MILFTAVVAGKRQTCRFIDNDGRRLLNSEGGLVAAQDESPEGDAEDWSFKDEKRRVRRAIETFVRDRDPPLPLTAAAQREAHCEADRRSSRRAPYQLRVRAVRLDSPRSTAAPTGAPTPNAAAAANPLALAIDRT